MLDRLVHVTELADFLVATQLVEAVLHDELGVGLHKLDGGHVYEHQVAVAAHLLPPGLDKEAEPSEAEVLGLVGRQLELMEGLAQHQLLTIVVL